MSSANSSWSKVRNRARRVWRRKSGLWGSVSIVFGLLLALARHGGEMQFVAQHWPTIYQFLLDWGPLVGFVIGGFLVAKAISDSSVQSLALKQGQEPTSEQDKVTEGRPVSFVLDGDWEDTPFQFKNFGKNDQDQEILGECLYIRIKALSEMKNVTVKLTARDTRSKSAISALEIEQGTFGGHVNEGLETEPILVWQRKYRMVNASYQKTVTESGFVRARVDVGDGLATVFPDTAHEAKVMFTAVKIEALLFRSDAPPELAEIVLDWDNLRRRPEVRLSSVNGPVEIKTGRRKARAGEWFLT